MNSELFEALEVLEKEKNISKDTLLDAIKQSLLQACKNHYGRNEANNVVVNIDPKTCEFEIYAEKRVVDVVEDDLEEISLADARMKDPRYELGDIVRVDIKSKEFGRIATQNAKNVILQKIREEERKVLFEEYYEKEKDIVTGIVQRYVGRNVSVNLGKVDAMLNERGDDPRRGISSDPAYQGVCTGSKGYAEGTEGTRIPDTSGICKAALRGRGDGGTRRYRRDQKHCA